MFKHILIPVDGTEFSDRAIVDAAEKHQCDLILMASHGRHGLDKLLHGNVAQGVVSHTKIPVLVMH